MTFEYNGFNIHLIETPGFDDFTHSDAELLMTIATYFSAMYKSKKGLDGIVYISSILDTRMSGSAVRNLDMLSKLVGDEALSEVVLVTSMWDLADSSAAESREKGLRERFWKHLIEKGSKVFRVDHRRLMALPVLDVLLLQAQRKALQIQRELVDDMRKWVETEAGRQLSKETQELQEDFRRDLEKLKSERDDTIAARDTDMQKYLREEQARLERILSQAENEKEALLVDFERLVREKEDEYASMSHQLASLSHQLETRRIEGLVRIEKLDSELEADPAQVQQNEGKCSQDFRACDDIHWTGVDLDTRLSPRKVSRYWRGQRPSRSRSVKYPTSRG